MKRQMLMAEIAYDKVSAALKSGKQGMVFVHSRKDTVKTARALAELAANSDGGSDLFGNADNEAAKRQGGSCERSHS